eukprot:scaffold10557_cov72-Cyclotella_meneghiniana.AAC.6
MYNKGKVICNNESKVAIPKSWRARDEMPQIVVGSGIIACGQSILFSNCHLLEERWKPLRTLPPTTVNPAKSSSSQPRRVFDSVSMHKKNKQQSADGEFRVEEVICDRWKYYTIVDMLLSKTTMGVR